MLRGLVEGYYGRPFVGGRRKLILKNLSIVPNAAYVYAPKNDPWHRISWRDSYPPDLWKEIRGDMEYAGKMGVDFIFGISPWNFSDEDHDLLRGKLISAIDSGASGVAVLFDDIPQKADAELARRQIRLAYRAAGDLDTTVYLCPSIYCIGLLEKHRGEAYLEAWRENCPSEWIPFWTGDEVVSRDYSKASIASAGDILGSPPAIWDNLLANDYCLRRIYLSNLEGRITRDNHYFLNPSECLPAVLYNIYCLQRVAGAEALWPRELAGDPGDWELFASFHRTPWAAGSDVSDLVQELSAALEKGAGDDLLSRLQQARSGISRLMDAQEKAPFGHDITAYLRDISRLLGQWLEALMLATEAERRARLEYLVMERLPMEHPLAGSTVRQILKRGDA